MLQKLIQETPSSECKADTVILVGAFGGRFDQEIATIHALYRWSACFERLILLSSDSVTCLLEAERRHVITPIQTEKLKEGNTCGLLPVGCKVDSITTFGLEWNLSGESLEMGKRISSSNRLGQDQSEVIVETSDPILWTSSYTID